MVLFRIYEKKKLLFILSLAIITMIIANTGIISNAQIKAESVSSGVERLKYWGDLLKQNIEKYAETRKDETVQKEEMILLLDNIMEILRIIRKIHEEEKLGEERNEKIERLIEMYEKKRSYYLLKK